MQFKNWMRPARVALFTLSCVAAPALYAADFTLLPNSPGVAGIGGNTTTGAPGFGSSSFYFNAVGDNKGELYLTAMQLFGHSVAVSDIASISYWTNKPVNGNPMVSPGVDWSLYLYTNLTGSGDTGSFYHSRLVGEPLYSNPTFTPDAWNQWSTGGTSALTFYDSARDAGVQGSSGDPTLADLQASAWTWAHSGTSNDYRAETIEYFSLQTGSAWSAGFLGLVDGLTITLANGEVARIDLSAAVDAIPEPESFALVGLGLAALVVAGRRKRAMR